MKLMHNWRAGISITSGYYCRCCDFRRVKSTRIDGPKTRITKRLNFDQFALVKKKARRENTETLVYGPSDDAKMAMVKCAEHVIRHAQRISKEFSIELVLVIDGDELPCKQSVNDK